MEWTWIGLGLIVLAWIVQIIVMLKKNKQLHYSFVGLQIIGILVLVISGWNFDRTLAILNALSGIAAIVVLALVIKK